MTVDSWISLHAAPHPAGERPSARPRHGHMGAHLVAGLGDIVSDDGSDELGPEVSYPGYRRVRMTFEIDRATARNVGRTDFPGCAGPGIREAAQFAIHGALCATHPDCAQSEALGRDCVTNAGGHGGALLFWGWLDHPIQIVAGVSPVFDDRTLTVEIT